jgi:drug/metabolite transporter (DMT)-like permease
LNTVTGELAALATSLLFSITSVFFTFASRQLGSIVLNRIRLLVAIAFLVLAHLLLSIPLPLHVSSQTWFWLGLSGVIGLVLGDVCLFQAYIWIGPRLTMLLMSLAPILAGVLAWIFFDETLNSRQIFGIALTLTGVGWVILEQNERGQDMHADKRLYWLGILFGLGAAAGQALGLVTARKGLSPDFPALTGTLIRMLAAAATLWGFTFLRGQARTTFKQISEKRSTIPYILGGAFAGPFLGVTLSLVAIQNAELGVASTLMALPPLFLLPIGYFVFKERFGWQAILGTIVAMMGVSLLFVA